MSDNAIVHEQNIAKHLKVTRDAILIDGEPVPWVVCHETICIEVDPEGVTVVYLPIYVERVEVESVLAT